MQKETIQRRIAELKQDQETGIQQMQQLETRKQELQHTLSRISGAIQVLEELLAEANTSSSSSDIPS